MSFLFVKTEIYKIFKFDKLYILHTMSHKRSANDMNIDKCEECIDKDT